VAKTDPGVKDKKGFEWDNDANNKSIRQSFDRHPFYILMGNETAASVGSRRFSGLFSWASSGFISWGCFRRGLWRAREAFVDKVACDYREEIEKSRRIRLKPGPGPVPTRLFFKWLRWNQILGVGNYCGFHYLPDFDGVSLLFGRKSLVPLCLYHPNLNRIYFIRVPILPMRARLTQPQGLFTAQSSNTKDTPTSDQNRV
jgi:hypothetical protein